MTGAEGAAAFFAENPLVDTVLATSDGNVWPTDEMNKAEFHAAKNKLDPPAEHDRSDDGMAALIDTAELVLLARSSRVDASRGVMQETPPPAPVVPPTYEEARSALGTALGIEDLTDLDEDYEEDGVVLHTIDAVIATWLESGMDVATWRAQSKNTRQEAVATKFGAFNIPL